MANYYLFLDEIKANDRYTHFCLGGCIIEDMVYRKHIIPYIVKLKSDIFYCSSIVLHECKISQKSNEFRVLKNKAKELALWNGMKKIFIDFDIKTLCVGIDYQKYKLVYKNKSNILNSEYYIALQIILENFVHFLQNVNGMGSVYLESRGIVEDMRLQEKYDIIAKQGTLFIDKSEFKKRLTTISFPMKDDNNIGIQIADFIPNPVARYFSGIKQKPLNLFDEIKQVSYDGNESLSERFGFKKVL